MNIEFLLPWGIKKGPWKRAFKHESLADMVEVFRERCDHFAKCEIVVCENLQALKSKSPGKGPAPVNWVCDLPRNREAKVLSSEELATKVQGLMNQGTATLRIFIGGPDGWSKEDLQFLEPRLTWSFGPMTLTHEMATLIATEQIYRAFTIVKGLPYHSGH